MSDTSDKSLIEQEAERKLQEMGRPFSRVEVVDIINSVISKVGHSEKDAQLYKELKALSGYIENAKQEISSLQAVNTIDQEKISVATDELDEVVRATEVATGAIMDSCEKFEAITAEITDESLKERMFAEITTIYEACGFQDITGQRITKVVKTLRYIEENLDSILGMMEEHPAAKEDQGSDQKEETLENGPQMPDQAFSQDDIDALLASFD